MSIKDQPVPMRTMQAASLPFLLHAVIETAAGISFIFFPHRQLPGCSADAKLIMRQYGALLLVSSVISLAVVASPSCDDATKPLAISLGFYHAWPCYRALARIRTANPDRSQSTFLGGPGVHLVVHTTLVALFIFSLFYESRDSV
ncbi:hypothetical protein F5Y16DRAFT_26229 [Xylariaceae sp. FL0255]|nr:hypothetical protein F5Y16DRAFT_26229 [Xylariaceae sp. FL0255]